MTITQHSAKHLHEVFFGGNWTWSNVRDQLADVDLRVANHQVNGFHTVAELTYHIDYYVQAVLSVLNGQPLNASDKYSFDLPPIGTQAEWESMVARMLQHAEALVERIKEVPDSRLHDVFVDPKYGTWFRNLHGLIEHTHYHLGQIALLKRMAKATIQS